MPTEPPAARPIAVEAVDLRRTYRTTGAAVQSIDGVSLTVHAGEILALTGPSGSGKSTLLYLLAGLDDPDDGTVRINGTDWRSLRGAARSAFRRTACGFIAQGRTLLPQATARENVEVPLLFARVEEAVRSQRVSDALDRVGLSGEDAKLPDQLSGGQQQRVAIARALVAQPWVVLADEPTASLDSTTAQAVTGLLIEMARENGAAVVMVTHDPTVACHGDRTLRLHSGRIDSGD